MNNCPDGFAGIDVEDFAELLIPSGLVLVDTHFVSFHSPYDFGYLLKILTNQAMPEEEDVSYLIFIITLTCP